MRSVRRWLIATLLLALVVPALAAGTRARIDGEVVAVDNEGEPTQIRVRTQDRVETWMRLGSAADYGERFRVGDRVRARVTQGEPGQPALVTSIRNRRSGERLAVRAKDGSLLQLRERDRAQEQTEQRTVDRGRQRDRMEAPGRGSTARPRRAP